MSRWGKIGLGTALLVGGCIEYCDLNARIKSTQAMMKLSHDTITANNKIITRKISKEFYQPRILGGEATTFSEVNNMLEENNTTWIPNDQRDKKQILQYLEWMSSVSGLPREIMNIMVKTRSHGNHINTLLSNAYVMDQLLLEKNYLKTLEIVCNSEKILNLECDDLDFQGIDLQSDQRYERLRVASQFLQDFSIARLECIEARKTLFRDIKQQQLDSSCDDPNIIGVQRGYHRGPYCPYVQRFVQQQQQ